MPPPDLLRSLRLPVVGAPMFIVSYPDLVTAQCKAGIVGAFPSLNARPLETLDRWLGEITRTLAQADAAPFAVNLIVEKSNSRLREDVGLVMQHKVPLVITSVGPPGQVVEAVHSYGGLVFHDVTQIRHAKRAIKEGVDGLILVAAGAGGHGGMASPFALVAEARAIWDGPLVLAGAISTGRQIRAAQMLGADLAYMGTRFIATEEANAPEGYKRMIAEGSLADIVYTPRFTGIPGNYLKDSLRAEGIDPDDPSLLLPPGTGPDLDLAGEGWTEKKAWSQIWSAGQGIGAISDCPSVAELVARLEAEYRAA